MISKIKKNKWTATWFLFTVFATVYTVISIFYWNTQWVVVWLQTGALVLTLLAMVIIMIQNSEQVNKSTNDQIEALNKATTQQLNAIEESTQTQINAIQNSTLKQVEVLLENTQKLITINKEESDKQITNFNESIQKQIEAHDSAAAKQLTAIEEATKTQISAIQNSTIKHIECLQENIEKLIVINKEESNKQIKNFNATTKEQMEAFLEQAGNVVTRLEDVAKVLVSMSDQNKEMLENEKALRDLEETKWLKRVEETNNAYWEKLEEKERYRPNVLIRFGIESHFLFWRGLHVYLYNNGGRASNIILNLSFRNSFNGRSKFVPNTVDAIERLHQNNIDLGWIKNYENYDQIIVELSVRDVFNREYYGKWSIQRNEQDWILLNTTERLQLSN